MGNGLIFAISAAAFFGLWTVFHQQAAKYINSLFGAIIVSFTAVVLGLIFFIPNIRTAQPLFNYRGLMFAVLAGTCALLIDLFALKAYNSGLQISVGGPIIIGGSIAIASVVGFTLGESVTLMKIAGLILVVAGASILAFFGK